MKKKCLVVASLLAVSLFALWQARLSADHRRAASVMHSLCREIQGYRQRTGQMPPTLDTIADGKKADWLKNLTNGVSINYVPGSGDRLPHIDVSVGYASIYVNGSTLDYSP